MCLLIAAKKKSSQALLKAGERGNKDGIGIAYRAEKSIKFFKGISLDDLITLDSKLKDGVERVIHFRAATSGGVKPELCHPFPISRKVELALSGEAPAVLGHNGVVSDWKDILRNSVYASGLMCPGGEFWSDTRAMAFAVEIFGPDFLDIATLGDRFAVLGTPEYWDQVNGLTGGTMQNYGFEFIKLYGTFFDTEDGVKTSRCIVEDKPHNSSLYGNGTYSAATPGTRQYSEVWNRRGWVTSPKSDLGIEIEEWLINKKVHIEIQKSEEEIIPVVAKESETKLLLTDKGGK